MEIRVLRPEEFDLLRAMPGQPMPDPDCTVVAAAFDGDRLVGALFQVALPHLEAAWIREDYRNRGLLKKLETIQVEHAKAYGIPRLFAFAADPQMSDYISRLGYSPLPWTVWGKEV